MLDFVEQIRSLHEHQEQAVLATIVAIDGSAYQREGAKMIFSSSGKQYGTLSAGCLESDLAIKVDEVLSSGKPQMFTYDMRSDDDLVWGLGSGCNGKVDIYAEPLSWDWIPPYHTEPLWPLIEASLKQGVKAAVAKSFSDQGKPSAVMGLAENGMVLGTLGDPDTDQLIKEQLLSFLNEDMMHSGKRTIFIEKLNESFFFDLYKPNDKLFIFGAGVDVEPVVRMASNIHFDVTVIDPREVRCRKEFFPNAAHLILAHPEQALKEIRITSNDYVLVMTHSFHQDLMIVKELADKSLKYIGILGPKRRTAKLFDTIQVPEGIHSPVGLDLGGDGPEEIAISIVAELLAIRNGKENPKPLKEKVSY